MVYLGHHACHGHLATHAQQSGEPSLCQVFYRTVRSLRPLRAFVPPLRWTFSSTCAAFCEVLPHHHLLRVGCHASLDLIATICVCCLGETGSLKGEVEERRGDITGVIEALGDLSFKSNLSEFDL